MGLIRAQLCGRPQATWIGSGRFIVGVLFECLPHNDADNWRLRSQTTCIQKKGEHSALNKELFMKWIRGVLDYQRNIYGRDVHENIKNA